MKMLLSVGLAVHAIIGNFCMMPMAFAQGMEEMEMSHEKGMEMEVSHEEGMEMNMTPMDMTSMLPMSPVHCEHCAKVTKLDANPMNSGMPCSSGHCITHTGPITSTAAPSANALAYIALPTSGIIFPPAPLNNSQPPSTAPPQAVRITDTIVLRL